MFFNKYITLTCGTKFKISQIQAVRLLYCILSNRPEGVKVVMENGRYEELRYHSESVAIENYELLMDAL